MKRHTHLFVFIITTLFFASCEKFEEIELGKEFTVRVGVTYDITEDLSFTLNKINDSRCPLGAVCGWEGDAVLYFEINYQTIFNDTIALRNSYRNTNPSYAGPYTIKLLDVEPYPKVNVHVDQKDLRVTMIISEE